MLSIVIPTLNADDHLPACLDAVRGDNEIVVVDGGSADASAVVAEAAGARVVRTARGRGTQLRAGAETARGDWLLFLHADTRLGAGWRETTAMYMASRPGRSEEHTSELQSLMRTSYAVFCVKKKKEQK